MKYIYNVHRVVRYEADDLQGSFSTFDKALAFARSLVIVESVQMHRYDINKVHVKIDPINKEYTWECRDVSIKINREILDCKDDPVKQLLESYDNDTDETRKNRLVHTIAEAEKNLGVLL